MTSTIDAIRRHRGTALGIARGFMRKLPRSVPRDDLEQAAMIGLFLWKKAHPDESAEGWIGGLRTRIRGAVIDELRAQDWLPRRHKGERMDVVVLGWDQVDPEWEKRISGAEEAIDFSLERRQLAEQAQRALPPRLAQVIDLNYYRGQTQVEISRLLGVCNERVSQLHSASISIMKEALALLDKEREQPVMSTLPDEGVDLKAELQRYQDWMVQQALIRCAGNKAAAARLLGIERKTLVEMMKRSGVLRPLAKCGRKPRGEET
jgi:RNA polymerase sigma factor (sigma-70 family)